MGWVSVVFLARGRLLKRPVVDRYNKDTDQHMQQQELFLSVVRYELLSAGALASYLVE